MRQLRFLLGVLAIVLVSVSARGAERPSVDELWKAIYDRPERVATLDRPAVVYLDIQHAEIVRGAWAKLADPVKECHTTRMRERFRELSGLECVVVHASEVARGMDLDRPLVKAILISGRNTTQVDTESRDREFYDLIRTTRVPMIGFCGGGQLIGKAYGMKVVRMRTLRPGEVDPMPSYHPGYFKERGFLSVGIVKGDPLFDRLSAAPVFKQSHAFQLSDVPPGFELLASSADCRVQVIKDRQRLVYGVQFHPEGYDAEHGDGRTLLENFFRMALK